MPSTVVWIRRRALAHRQHAGHGLADRALAATGRRVQARGDAARVPCGPHFRYRDRPPRHPRGIARHGGDDACPYRRPHIVRRSKPAWRTRSAPASALPIASRNTARLACTTRRAGARRPSATCVAPAERAGAEGGSRGRRTGRAGGRPRLRRTRARRSCCSRRPTGSAGKF